jgi:hypothetical protein
MRSKQPENIGSRAGKLRNNNFEFLWNWKKNNFLRNYMVEDGDIIFFKFNAGAGLTTGKKK